MSKYRPSFEVDTKKLDLINNSKTFDELISSIVTLGGNKRDLIRYIEAVNLNASFYYFNPFPKNESDAPSSLVFKLASAYLLEKHKITDVDYNSQLNHFNKIEKDSEEEFLSKYELNKTKCGYRY